MTLRPCLVFGEVLFDRFPDGRRVLGGAPFNVARHLHGLGVPTLFVGRVGRDEPGDEVRRRLRAWGMDTTGLQRDPARPTGTVEVRLDRRDAPEFRIPADQAWDAVEARPAIEAAATLPDAPPVLYHGTLALRTPRGLATLNALRSQTGARIFVDVNLRAPWWDRSSVRTQLAHATWAKMNEDELVELTGDRAGPGTDAARASWLASRAELELLEILWITRGADGAVAHFGSGSTVAAPAPRARPLVDTVGTGDAFSAVAILGLLDGWDVETTLRRAVELAAELCRHRGAIPDDPTFYEEARRRWKDDR